MRLLNERPDTGLEAIASAAGVTRQTVYAHFPSREDLLSSVVDEVTEQAVAAMDASGLDDGPAAEALLRALDASRRALERHPGLVQAIGTTAVSAQADRERHAPVADRLRQVIRRGQASGEFDSEMSPDWLVAATIALGHAASDESSTGRMPPELATAALRASLLRLYGAGTVESPC